MSGVEPVAKHRLPEKLTLRVRRCPQGGEAASLSETNKRGSFSLPKGAYGRVTALMLFGSMLSMAQPSVTGHLDATHLLGLDGPGVDRWQTFLVASPAGSIHNATLDLDDGPADLAHAGIGRITADGVRQTAIAPDGQSDDDLITGSISASQTLADGRDPLVTHDARADRLVTPAVHALLESRRTPLSLFEQHPFAQLEMASLPTDGFGGYIGMVPPTDPVMIAEDTEAPAAAEAIGSEYAMAMVDPSAATSALAQTEGQQQISAFLGNDRQFQCLAEGIYFEARGEPRRGQVAVAQVIMNRVNHDEFPDTICSVVYQNQHWRNRCQFSFACDGVPERVTERAAWDMAEDVARQVLEGRDLIDTITESTHYHATYVRPRWAPRMIRLDRVGLHVFYKGRYGGWR